MDFIKVSKELARSWGCLSVNEKEKYKKLANERKKLIVAAKTNEIQFPKKSFEFIFKNLQRHSTSININLPEIKKNIFGRTKFL